MLSTPCIQHHLEACAVAAADDTFNPFADVS
jgi:hypothetical protein